MQSSNMNSFVNISQQYGPNIAQQAMATVSVLLSSSMSLLLEYIIDSDIFDKKS